MSDAPDTSLVQRQAKASNALNDCTTIRDMAAAIAQQMLESGQFLSINVARYNTAGVYTGFDVVATANRQQAFESSEVVRFEMTLEEVGGSIGGLFDETLTPALIEDIGTLPPKLRDWLSDFKIQALFALPMRAMNRTFGFLAVNSVGGELHPSAAELQAYQTLTNQMSTLIRLHHLIEQSEYTQALSERMSLAFNRLVIGQDFVEMAKVIARHMLPQKGRFLAINGIDYNSRGEITGWRALASANRNQALATDPASAPNWFDINVDMRRMLEDGEIYAIDDLEAVGSDTIGIGIYEWLRSIRVRSILAVPLLDEGRPVAVLIVMSRSVIPFTKEETSAFHRLADQMGVLFHVRTLLQQAQETRNVVESLVLASRLITTATDYTGMTQAVIYTVGKHMTAVGMTLFDRGVSSDEQPASRTLVALNANEVGWRLNGEVFRGEILDNARLSRLRGGMPLVMEDLPGSIAALNAALSTDEIPAVSQPLQAELVAQGIHWRASFGLRAGDYLLGTLEIFHNQPYSLTAEEVDAYTTLADQVGNAVRSRQLLDDSRTAQALAARLVETNHQISLADRPEDITRAALAAMPELVEVAVVALFDRAVSVGEAPYSIHSEAVAMRQEILEPLLADYPQSNDPRIIPAIQRLMNGEMIVVPDSRQYEAILTPKLIAFLQEHGIYAFVSMGLQVGRKLTGLMTFGASDALPMNATQQANFRALADQIAITLENRNLLTKLSQQVGVLRTLNDLASNVDSSQDEKQLLDRTCEALVDTLKVDHVGFALLDGDGKWTTVISEFPPQGVIGTKLNTRDDPLQRELREKREAVLVEDMENDARLEANNRRVLREIGIKSLLVLPVLDVNERYIGSVGFDLYTRDRHFTPEVIEIARTVTAQVSVSLQNIRLLQDAQRRAEQLQHIAVFSQSVQASLEQEELYRVALTQCAHIFRLDHISMVSYDAQTNHFRAAARYDDGKISIDLHSGDFISTEKTIAARILETRSILSIGDLQEGDLRYGLRDDIRAVIAAPIFTRGLPTGMILIGSKTRYSYNETDIAVFQQMVNQLGVSFENADVYSQSQLLAKNKALANEIATRLQQQTDMDSILKVTVNELGKALGARRARIRLDMQRDDGS